MLSARNISLFSKINNNSNTNTVSWLSLKHFSMARTKTTVRPEPKTVADKIKQVCTDAFLKKEKPSRQYIKKAMAEKYDYTNESIIKMLLGSMVKYGKLIQKGQTFYARGFVLEAKRTRGMDTVTS